MQSQQLQGIRWHLATTHSVAELQAFGLHPLYLKEDWELKGGMLIKPAYLAAPAPDKRWVSLIKNALGSSHKKLLD